MDSLVELDVDALLGSWDKEVLVELLADILQEFQAFFEACLGATHTYVFPHDVAEFLVDRVYGTLALDVHEAVNLV